MRRGLHLLLPALTAAQLLVATSAAAGEALDGRTAETTARVQAWLDSWRTLSARFEQVVSSPSLPRDQVESGRLRISRPDRMRWDYEDPEDKLALCDGVHTWLYLPSDRQVVKGSLRRLREDSAVALLLSGTLRLEDAFRVSAARSAGDGAALELIPVRPSESIGRVIMGIEAGSGRVLSIQVDDPAGNRIRYLLSHIVENEKLSEGLFSFRVPRGVEVQDLEAEAGDGR